MPQIENFIGQVSLHNFILFIFALIFTFILGGFLNFILIKYLKGKTTPPVYKTLSKIAMYGTYAAGLYLAFNRIIHFDVAASLTALGILGIAISLPTVPILQNIAAGIILSIERPFREEDIIEVNGTLCKVKDVMLRKTRLRALDGRIITMPNLAFMTSTPIINYSRGEFIKITVNVDISSESDLSKAKEKIKKICSENPYILPHIPEKKKNRLLKILEVPRNFFMIPKNLKDLTPKVYVKKVDKDKVSLEVWFWTWDIKLKERIISLFYDNLIDEFKNDGIKFG